MRDIQKGARHVTGDRAPCDPHFRRGTEHAGCAALGQKQRVVRRRHFAADPGHHSRARRLDAHNGIRSGPDLGRSLNDAPSLRASDVGISVSNAVGVAREAAEIILLDRGLDVLHRGIREGRAAFGSVMKYVLMETSSNFGNMFSMAAAAIVLPFLPMLPTQILLNNFLYDLSQITIPGDRVDATYLQKPQRWDIATIRRFMLLIGPISSIFNFVTFWFLLKVFHSSAALFHTGWFVESLATQTLVLFVIRTAANPFRSRPSLALVLTASCVIAAALILPFTPLGAHLGFVPLPARYFAFLGAVAVSYLAIVEVMKRRVMVVRA
jgi:Mg2+-importing ATPase